MPDNDSRPKRSPPQPSVHGLRPGKKQSGLHGENGILELISIGAPVPDILNRLCAAIDLQIGNVVSVIMLANAPAHDPQTIARSALKYGLSVFWTARIPAGDENLLATFEMYCCGSRAPAPSELQLIQRVTHLAALAIRRENGEEDFESLSSDWKNALANHAPQGPLLN
jgi:hypothetical protein